MPFLVRTIRTCTIGCSAFAVRLSYSSCRLRCIACTIVLRLTTPAFPSSASLYLLLVTRSCPLRAGLRPGRRDPALGGPGRYRFYMKRVTGPCTHSYNVPKDRILGPSAKDVSSSSSRSPHAGPARGVRDSAWRVAANTSAQWPLSLLQRAQSACQSTAAVRGGEQSRPSPLPLRWSRCAARLPHIEADERCRASNV